MPERIVAIAQEVARITRNRLKDIHKVTRHTKIIAINAMVESARLGAAGNGFAVVAGEVGTISTEINSISDDLQKLLDSRINELDHLGQSLISRIRGERLVDLCIGMIDIVDRNLYERSCDVRWWATDSAAVDALTGRSPDLCRRAAERLAVILKAYTVYVDIWLISPSGQVLANGAHRTFPNTQHVNVSQEKWFQEAWKSRSGNDFAVADIQNSKFFNQTVATYAAAVRREGQENGEAIGVLAIFFDWQKQSQTVLNNIRLNPEEKQHSRCLILDAKFQVIAASDKVGVLSQTFPLKTQNRHAGHYADGGVVGFAQTVGYETYPGLGWYGVITQKMTA